MARPATAWVPCRRWRAACRTCANLLGRVRFLEQLLGDLPKVVDEPYGGVSLKGVLYAEDVHVPLVEEGVENVDRVHRRRALLLVPKNQVYPFMQPGRQRVWSLILHPILIAFPISRISVNKCALCKHIIKVCANCF